MPDDIEKNKNLQHITSEESPQTDYPLEGEEVILGSEDTHGESEQDIEGSRLVEIGLTSSEVKMLSLLATGQSNNEMAISLGTTRNAVRKMLQRIYKKLGTSDRAEATTLARENLRGLGNIAANIANEEASKDELEFRVLKMLNDGASNQEMADQEGVSIETIKRRLAGLYWRLGFRDQEFNRYKLLAEAIDEGLLENEAEPLDRSILLGLTDEQVEVLWLGGRGMNDSEIARRLKISIKTVENRMDRLRQNLGVKDRTELIRRWRSTLNRPRASLATESSEDDITNGEDLPQEEDLVSLYDKGFVEDLRKINTGLPYDQNKIAQYILGGFTVNEIASLEKMSRKKVREIVDEIYQQPNIRRIGQSMSDGIFYWAYKEKIVPTDEEPLSEQELDKLGDTEREILVMVGEGYENQEISDRFNIKVDTVTRYIRDIMQILRIETRLDLIRRYIATQQDASEDS